MRGLAVALIMFVCNSPDFLGCALEAIEGLRLQFYRIHTESSLGGYELHLVLI